jgi:hypothetical protein
MFRWLSIALLAATAWVPISSAQLHTGFGRGGGTRGIGLHRGAHRLTRGFYPGSPYFYSDYDSGEPYPIYSDFQPGETSVASAPPQILVVQPASAGDSARSTRSRPLLIERRGDRYVRFGGAQEAPNTGPSAQPDYEASAVTKPTQSATEKKRMEALAGEPASAILVYRDGHREEIAGYAIADGVIYVRGDYWQNGSWTKHIPLAALNPSATIQANQQRGVKFIVPSASNVVIASF